MYAYVILFTPLMILNVIPLPATTGKRLTATSIIISLIAIAYIMALFILAIINMFKLAPQFNRVLHFPGGLILPGKKAGKLFARVLLVLFFVWVSLWDTVLLHFVDPKVLQANTYGWGLGMGLLSLEAGPTEEMWRWAFILSIFYVAMRFSNQRHQRYVLCTVLIISCALFGMGHIGELKGYDLFTALDMSLAGALLILFAYWSRSFWIPLLTHSLHNFAVYLSFSQSSFWSCWLVLGVLWSIVVFYYYRWHKSVMALHSTDNAQIPY